MSESEKTFINEFRRQVIIIFVVTMATLASTGISFYYTTNNAIANISMAQTNLRDSHIYLETQVYSKHSLVDDKLAKIQHAKIEKEDYVREIDELKQLIRDLNRKVDNLR